jgi:hypothetical protein
MSTAASVMDSELDRGQKPNTFCVRISFSEQDEISFDCAGCTVTMSSTASLKRLIGRRRRIPRCGVCRSHLLTLRRVGQVLRQISKQPPNEPLERPGISGSRRQNGASAGRSAPGR